MKYDILFNGTRRNIEFTPPDDESSPVTAIVDGRMIAADVAKITSGVYSILFGGRSIEAIVEESAERGRPSQRGQQVERHVLARSRLG